MIHRAIIFAAFGMVAISTLTKAQQRPLTVSEISPGLFVHTGVMELITRGNEGPLPKLVRYRSRCGCGDGYGRRCSRGTTAARGPRSRIRERTCKIWQWIFARP